MATFEFMKLKSLKVALGVATLTVSLALIFGGIFYFIMLQGSRIARIAYSAGVMFVLITVVVYFIDKNDRE